jgi:sterol desaturase/sphingolipid hydroxylase (fatty acid hydroxylase superfamily)
MEINSIIEQLMNKYTMAAVIIWICSLALKSPSTPWYQATFGIAFMHFWVYWVHRSLHYIPTDGIIGFLNTHIRFHHQFDKPIPRELELFFEVIIDLAMNLSLLLLEWLFNFYIIPVPIIVLFGIAYTSVHLINYSIIGNIFHRRHHTSINKNYAPDIADHVFGTNYNEEMEDLVYTSLNAFWTMLVLYPLKEYLGWPK